MVLQHRTPAITIWLFNNKKTKTKKSMETLIGLTNYFTNGTPHESFYSAMGSNFN
jgi:hypothetical protein